MIINKLLSILVVLSLSALLAIAQPSIQPEVYSLNPQLLQYSKKSLTTTIIQRVTIGGLIQKIRKDPISNVMVNRIPEISWRTAKRYSDYRM